MRIVVATDSFKGSLTAEEACGAVAQGIARTLPDAHLILCPLADGGEGTAGVLRRPWSGSWVNEEVTGPLPGARVAASWLWLPERGPEALVEVAAASGLALLSQEERRPLLATTLGTGELIGAAAERGARHIFLAAGGSATVDGGTGAARALGWRFEDGKGEPLPPGGAALLNLEAIRRPQVHRLPEVTVLCDVDNPLLGEQGAARTFGPQKGATREMVAILEAGLHRLSAIVRRELGIDISNLPGGGAAGGLAAGAFAFFGARLLPGIDFVMEAVGFEELAAGADWVITGEGRLDPSSLRGKVVSGVARAARQLGLRLAVVAGGVELAPPELESLGSAAWEAVTGGERFAAERPEGPASALADAAARLAARLGSQSRQRR